MADEKKEVKLVTPQVQTVSSDTGAFTVTGQKPESQTSMVQAPKQPSKESAQKQSKEKSSKESKPKDAKAALAKTMKRGLPRDAGGFFQSLGDKLESINEARQRRELENLESAKRTLAGAINSGDKALVRAALVQFFDVCPEDLEIESAVPSLSAMKLRNTYGIDYLIGQALLILSEGSSTERNRVLETLETEFKGPMYGYIDFLRNNPELDAISNREYREKILLKEHLLYDQTMPTAEKKLIEYLRNKRVREGQGI